MYGRLYDTLNWIRNNLESIGLIIGGIAAVILVIILIIFAVISHNNWVSWCEDQGGHVISDTDTSVGTGFDSGGNVTTVTTTNTDYYCLNENGGIIDIR